MGRPEPVVLFAQTILHSQLDEYVDEMFDERVPFAFALYVTASTNYMANAFTKSDSDSQEINKILTEAGNELSEIWKNVHAVADSNDNGFASGVDEEMPMTKILVELFNRCFPYYKNVSLLDVQCPSQSAVVKVISDLPADKLSTDGIPFLISASVDLAEMSGSAANRILSVPLNSDELLWVLWELCAISRSDSGRQALLALGYFPEAISVLLRSLSSYKDLDSVMDKNGGSPLGLAIFHSAAEILEVLVADSTASSLKSWIGFAVDLHKALHSSSPGSNRKDAPTRLLEWIDAGVVYQRNGARGLLRYSAILASGGDAHLSSGNVLVSDSMDVENVVADSNSSSDGQIIDNLLGKLVADKYFDGLALCSTSVVQLTTAFRILAFISDDKAVASSLFEEGAVTVIYIVLMNCKSMLERLSNSYDYLVDEGAELSSTTELLLDRTHEQAIVDLMIPSLGDLFPDEGIWLWKVELPSLSAIRSLSTSTVLGPQVEKEVNWYMHPEHVAILLVRLMPQLDRLARIIDNFATSALMVIQDMLRIFIVRVASEKIECAVVLLRPIFIWLDDKVDETSLSERDIFKVHQLLQFVVKLSEHPNGKALLWKMGIARILRKLLQNCSSASFSDDATFGRASCTNDLMLKWRIPLFKALAYIFSIDPSNNGKAVAEETMSEKSVSECSSIMRHLLMFCQCWKKIIKYIGSNQPTDYLVETIYSLTLGAIALSQYGENLQGLLILRYLFGLPSDPSGSSNSSGESLNEIALFMKTFEEKICQGFENSKTYVGKSLLPQVLNSITLLRSILEDSGLSADSVQMVLEEGTDSPSRVARSVVMTAHLMPSLVDVPVNDESPFLFSNAWKVIVDSEEPVDSQEGEFAKRLVWELPDSSLDRQLGQSARRKLALGENARSHRPVVAAMEGAVVKVA
nr:unnamed protein product [Digitaria exilis]